MRINARWTGVPPKVGDYMKTQLRPKGAYHIQSVSDVVSTSEDAHRMMLDVELVPFEQVPPKAIMHTWKWDSRAPKTGTRSGGAWSSR